jgi:hypothetical protein
VVKILKDLEMKSVELDPTTNKDVANSPAPFANHIYRDLIQGLPRSGRGAYRRTTMKSTVGAIAVALASVRSDPTGLSSAWIQSSGREGRTRRLSRCCALALGTQNGDAARCRTAGEVS